jgi:hypothetical protein
MFQDVFITVRGKKEVRRGELEVEKIENDFYPSKNDFRKGKNDYYFFKNNFRMGENDYYPSNVIS